MYAQATDVQLEAKLRVLEASVAQSNEVVQSTTGWQRFISMLTVGANRRALSQSFFSFLSGEKSRESSLLFLLAVIGCGLQAFQQLCGL